MIKVNIIIASDHFQMEGETTLDEISPFLDKWYETRTAAIQLKIDTLAKRVGDKVEDLKDARDSATS